MRNKMTCHFKTLKPHLSCCFLCCFFLLFAMPDIALDFLHRFPHLATAKDKVLRSNALFRLSDMPEIFPSASRLAFWQQWIYSCIPMQSIATTDDNIRINIPDQSPSESKNIILQVSSKLRGFAINLLAFLGIKQIYDMKKIHFYSDKVHHVNYKGNDRWNFFVCILQRAPELFIFQLHC